MASTLIITCLYVVVVPTKSCTSQITRATIRVAKAGENQSATKRCAWYAYYCRSLGLLQRSQCWFAAAATDQSVLYDTMAVIIIVRTMFCGTMYLVHNKRMIRDRYTRINIRKGQCTRYHLAPQHSSNDSSISSVRATYHRQTATTKPGGHALLPCRPPGAMTPLLCCSCCSL